MMEKRQTTTVMNIDDFIDEHSRQGTINDINDLYEDSYKELYLDKCDDFNDLQQMYDFEVMRNEDMKEIIKKYEELANEEIIEQMNEFIATRQKRIAKVIQRGKRRTY